jgi:WD40 repeat protein
MTWIVNLKPALFWLPVLLLCACGISQPSIQNTAIATIVAANPTTTILHTGDISGFMSVAWSPNGQILASGGHNGTIQLWRVSDGRLIRTLEGHTSTVNSVAWSPDGHTLASGSSDSTVRLWSILDQ